MRIQDDSIGSFGVTLWNRVLEDEDGILETTEFSGHFKECRKGLMLTLRRWKESAKQ